MSRESRGTVRIPAYWEYLQTTKMGVREQSILRPVPCCYLGKGIATAAIDNAAGEVGVGMDGRGRG